jgi:asparagine synthase (glutamine-hydrolysing)
MTEAQSHRGQDWAGTWIEGQIGLAHQMFHTTPESLRERLPLARGHLAMTADARIDNREELIDALGLRNDIADSELILAAYEKWGQQCAEKLLGDFAFAIWDRRNNLLYCARDHFGVKPFYYSSSSASFCFATEIAALLGLPQVSRRLNELMIAEHLTGAFQTAGITYYQDILRLPPAHFLVADENGIRLHRYWELNTEREIRLDSDEEYAEAFRELFTEAVRCRLRSAWPVGSMLSGGLDSSSIACTAQRLLRQNGDESLPTFSAVFDRVAQCDERDYIDAVLERGNFEPHFVRGDQVGPLTDIERVLQCQGKAVFGPNLFLHWALFSAARDRGIRVLLDGFDGDTTVSYGFEYLNELASAGRWMTLAMEARGMASNFEMSAWEILRSYAWHFRLRKIFSESRPLRVARRAWKKIRRRPFASRDMASEISPLSLLNPDFARRIGFEERFLRWRNLSPRRVCTEREGHLLSLTQASLPLALEIFDSAAAAFSIEQRYPFWDRRLVEFCLALPPQQKLHRGWTRVVMRRAMQNIIPSKVQWRAEKTDFVPAFRHGLLSLDRKRLEEMALDQTEQIRDYLDVAAFNRLFERVTSETSAESGGDLIAFWQVASLSLWLRFAQADTHSKGGESNVIPGMREEPRSSLGPVRHRLNRGEFV